MTVDLSENYWSTTSVFIELLPMIEAFNNITYFTENEKKDKIVDLITETLIKAINNCPNDRKGISRDQVTKVRNIISQKDDVAGIIHYLKCAIRSGKNYNTNE